MTGVMGFVAQCEVCPQKAILTDQPDGWVCPRCAEVAEPTYPYRLEGHGHIAVEGQLIGVELSDGTIYTERVGQDGLSAPERAAKLVERALEIARTISGIGGGFGDVDVAQGEVVLPPAPITHYPWGQPIPDEHQLPYRPPPRGFYNPHDDDDDDCGLGQVQG